MACSSSAVPQVKKHDVFLSFRGEDTRNGFTSHLHAAFCRAGIETFIDDNIDRGNTILPTLLSTIQNSTICVIIFSRKYANSRWCLSELETILQYKNDPNVIPVFYEVKPNHVRHQIEDFGKAFDELRGRFGKETLDRWRTALKQVADKSGFDSDNRKGSELVVEIVKRVGEILNRKSSYYNNGAVGVQSTIEKVESLLGIGSEENLRMVGIWGMCGIGKTTIATEVYHRNKNRFEKAYIARSVKEELGNRNPQNTLQQKILLAILGRQNADINDENIKRQLGCKNVLILLDDVEFDVFIKNFINCLSRGSRIIMTTRNKQVLKNYEVHISNIYKVEGLLDKDALELFIRFASGQNDLSSGFSSLSKEVVKYAKGVPLALIELGKHLVGKNEKAWECKLRKLEVYPHMEIQDVLESSLDGLDFTQRNIFLDVACFLRWENIDLVMKFLDACGFFPEEGIKVLIDRCLMALSNNKMTMHDLLQVMGWGVVHNESPNDFKQRSRLCHHADIDHIMKTELGTNKIEGICLDMSKICRINASPASAEMKELRLFKLHNSNGRDDNINKINNFQGIKSVNLKYLCWHGCPLRSLQSYFHAENLVVLDISYSKVKQFWTGGGSQRFNKLKHINLSHSQQLVRITNLSVTPNLETLILEGCTELREISSSIEDLNKLVMLNLRHCKSLKNLPNIWKLVSLEDLHLLECTELDQNGLKEKIKDVLQKIEHPEVRASQTLCICFPGTEIHEWFIYRFTGSSITLKRPLDWFNKRFVSFALCAIIDYGNYQCGEQGLKVGYDFKHGSVVFHSGTLRSWDYGSGPCFVDSDHVFLCFEFRVPVPTANNRYNNEMTIKFYVKDLKNEPIDNCEVKMCGFRSLDYQEVENPADGAVFQEEENVEPQNNRRKSLKFHKKLLNFLPCTRPAGQLKVKNV